MFSRGFKDVLIKTQLNSRHGFHGNSQALKICFSKCKGIQGNEFCYELFLLNSEGFKEMNLATY